MFRFVVIVRLHDGERPSVVVRCVHLDGVRRIGRRQPLAHQPSHVEVVPLAASRLVALRVDEPPDRLAARPARRTVAADVDESLAGDARRPVDIDEEGRLQDVRTADVRLERERAHVARGDAVVRRRWNDNERTAEKDANSGLSRETVGSNDSASESGLNKKKKQREKNNSLFGPHNIIICRPWRPRLRSLLVAVVEATGGRMHEAPITCL